MRFEALQARYGDSLLLTFSETSKEPKRLLVDGGPPGVYISSLKPRLNAEQAKYPKEKPLKLHAVMISHIDADHIAGVIDLFQDLQDAEVAKRPWPYLPTWLLHNSFDALSGEGEGGVARAIGGGNTVLASLGGKLKTDSKDETARLVLQSYAQGTKLSTLAAALKIARNPPGQDPLVFVPGQPRVLHLGNATLTIVGPLQKQIDKLRKAWAKWKKDKDTASLAAYDDTSVANLSSIVVLIEEDGKSVLITGDARGDFVLEALGEAGLIGPKKVLKVDVLKLPHHGSIRNLDESFFEKIVAKHYVASGDGTYGNPDRDTLLMLKKVRPKGPYSVHLTYDAAHCDETHKAWRKSSGKSAFKAATDGISDIIADWKATKGATKVPVTEGAVSIPL